MLSTISTKATTNGRADLPSQVTIRLLIDGTPVEKAMLPKLSEKGNTRYEFLEHVEVANEAAGKKILEGLKAKLVGIEGTDDVLMVADKIFRSVKKTVNPKDKPSFTKGGWLTVEQETAESFPIAGLNYRGEIRGTVVRRSRDKQEYWTATIGGTVIRAGGGGRKPKEFGGEAVIVKEF